MSTNCELKENYKSSNFWKHQNKNFGKLENSFKTSKNGISNESLKLCSSLRLFINAYVDSIGQGIQELKNECFFFYFLAILW
jgi:hypothetical protein